MGHVRWLEGDRWATWGQDRPEGGKRNKPGPETPEHNSRALANARRLSQGPLVGVIALLWGSWDASPGARNSWSVFLCLKIAKCTCTPTPPHPHCLQLVQLVHTAHWKSKRSICHALSGHLCCAEKVPYGGHREGLTSFSRVSESADLLFWGRHEKS